MQNAAAEEQHDIFEIILCFCLSMFLTGCSCLELKLIDMIIDSLFEQKWQASQ